MKRLLFSLLVTLSTAAIAQSPTPPPPPPPPGAVHTERVALDAQKLREQVDSLQALVTKLAAARGSKARTELLAQLDAQLRELREAVERAPRVGNPPVPLPANLGKVPPHRMPEGPPPPGTPPPGTPLPGQKK